MEGLLAAHKAGKISAKELGDALMALGQLANRDDAETRADPPVSEKQRRAMYAAASGKSTLGIPKKVGKEFTEADPGGKLPEHKDDSNTDEARIAGTKAGREGKTPRDNPYKSSDPDYDVWESYRLSGTKQRAYKELGLPIRAA